jgi:pyridoxal phosphate enzyme (YggS family)
MSSPVAIIAENLARVRDAIAEAAARSGRTASDVQLVAVTKYGGPDLCRQVVEAGCKRLGENRPQSLWDKAEALADLDVEWHQIGTLQRNKVRKTLPIVSLTHSIESVKLLEAVDRIAEEDGLKPRVLLEVNTSGDETKHGFTPEELPGLGETIAGFGQVQVVGLMCMAAESRDLNEARRNFASLRLLRDRLQRDWPHGKSLTELSMGMSGDYAVAIEEGATIVRVGSSLYEGLN